MGWGGDTSWRPPRFLSHYCSLLATASCVLFNQWTFYQKYYLAMGKARLGMVIWVNFSTEKFYLSFVGVNAVVMYWNTAIFKLMLKNWLSDYCNPHTHAWWGLKINYKETIKRFCYQKYGRLLQTKYSLSVLLKTCERLCLQKSIICVHTFCKEIICQQEHRQ